MKYKDSSWKLAKLNSAKEKLDKLAKKQKLPLYVIRGIEDIFNEILDDGSGLTITSAVKDFFVKNHFTIKTDGIGWKISY